jgi:hypothetical protein
MNSAAQEHAEPAQLMIAKTPAGVRPMRLPGFSAGSLWSIGILLPNIISIIFQATQQSRGVSESELGTLGAAFVLGRGIVIGTAPFWVYRSNPRWVSTGAILAAAAALLAVAFLFQSDQLGYGWFLVGLTSGCVATPAYTALGNSRDPLRAYSVALFGATLIAAIVAYLLPAVVVPHYGEQGALIIIAGLFLATIPCAAALRDWQFVGKNAAPPEAPSEVRSIEPRRTLAAPIVAAIAGAIFTGVVMGGVGAFVASIATANGIGSEAVGLFVAVALICSLAGALVPTAVGERFSVTMMIGVATVGIIGSYVAMTSASPVAFGIGFAAHATFATMGYVYYLGLVRSLDFTDRIYVAYPAIDAAAFAASAELAGQLLSRHSSHLLFLASGAALTACWIGAIVAQKIASFAAGPSRNASARSVVTCENRPDPVEAGETTALKPSLQMD